jgi:hypothetical protein
MVTTRIVTSMQWQIVPIITSRELTIQIKSVIMVLIILFIQLHELCQNLFINIKLYVGIQPSWRITCSVAVSRVGRLAAFRSDLFIGLKIRTIKIIIK